LCIVPPLPFFFVAAAPSIIASIVRSLTTLFVLGLLTSFFNGPLADSSLVSGRLALVQLPRSLRLSSEGFSVPLLAR
jgi:hypothetical protein